MEKRKHLHGLLKKAKAQYKDDYLVIAIPNLFTRKFRGYCAIREDLLLVSEYISRIAIEHDSVLRSALNYSFIAIYGKCFTDATQSKYPKLETSTITNHTYLATHEYLMELRHKFIAHRGDTANEVGIAVILIPKEGTEQTQMQYKQVRRLSLSSENLQASKNLITFLIAYVEEKIKETGQKAHSGFLEMFTPEELSIMILNNMNDDEEL
jgi:hypothetical protein